MVEGDSPIQIDDELTIIPTPGHTCGSMCFLWRDVLFTGDHMAFSAKLGHLYAFRGACWYSWPEVVKSLAKLLAYDFRAVLPGHGAPWFGDLSNAQAQMARCLEWARGA
ncbi:MAG: hypothetical protein KDB07_09545 [Planctomycetes bacterium]|nr:hypothetical protein [Planctomycetota bacterium]